MKQAVHILKKDARRLWPLTALSLVLLVLYFRGSSPPLAARANTDNLRILRVVLQLCWTMLIAAVVQEEPLVNERAFWITRPYARKSLLLSKLLFVFLFLSLPVFAGQCYILSANGFSPASHIVDLLWVQTGLVAVVVAPAFATAALTRDYKQFVLLCVACLVLGVALLPILSRDARILIPDVVWVQPAVMAAIALVASAGITLILYLGRRPMMAAIVFACGVAAIFALCNIIGPKTAFAIQSAITRNGVAADSIRFSIDPTPSRLKFWVVHDERAFAMPILLDKPDGVTFNLARTVIQIGAEGEPVFEERAELYYLTGNKYSLQFGLKDLNYKTFKDKPVSFHADFYVSVFGDQATSRVSATSTRMVVPHSDGICYPQIYDSGYQWAIRAGCIFAFKKPLLTTFYFGPNRGYYDKEKAQDYSPFPLKDLLYPLLTDFRELGYWYRDAPNSYEYVVESSRLQGYTVGKLNAPSLYLENFEMADKVQH